MGIKDPAVQAALRDAAQVLDRRTNPPIAPDLIFDPHAPVPEKMSKRDRSRLQDLRKAYQASLKTRPAPLLATPEAVAATMAPIIGHSKVEHLYVLPLDARSKLIGDPVMLSRGDVDGTDASVRACLRTALIAGAVSYIVCHNHPSGEVDPSPADINVTRRLVAGGKAVDCELLDHVIVNNRGAFTSLRRNDGHIWREA